MTAKRRFAGFMVLGLVMAAAVATAAAQAANANQTPSQFYMAYRTAFDKATKVDDIKQFQSKNVLAQIQATPPAQRADMFKMIKMMGTVTNVKVVKETLTKTGATLSVEALDSDKKKTTGEITLVKEDGGWKLDKEEWK
jgi:hypothetical protein